MLKLQSKVLAFVVLACLLNSNVDATENGLTSYPVGVNTVLNGVLPPPGQTEFYNYTLYYTANKFVGNDGNNLLPKFKLDLLVDAPRAIHTWGTMLGPFTVSSGLIVPIVHLRADTPFGQDNRTAIGDVMPEPLLIGYSNASHTFFAYLGTDVSLPTGSFSANRIANTGRNVYALSQHLDVTWFPTSAVELSSTALVEFSSPNSATRYHSGVVGMLEYLAGYSFNKQWQIGVQGYLLKQFTDDTVNGMPIPGGGFRGQAVAVGPQLRYMFSDAAAIAFKYQHEFAVRNRPQGQKFWVEFCFPI